MQAVQTKQFEGPLDLLLNLIEKEKLDICKISLAKVTNSFLEEIKKISVSSEKMAEFLVVASKLLYLKSQAVLPSLADDEEEEIRDLEEQLREYKRFKEMSGKISEIVEKNQRSFEPGVRNFKMNVFLPPLGVDLDYLANMLQEALNRLPKEDEKKERKFEPKVTLEEKVNHLHGIIKKQKKFSFQSVIKEARTKGEVIVTFLALLEMIKRKIVVVKQSQNFADITVSAI